MAFFFLCLFTFIMFFQPTFVFPVLLPICPYRLSLLLALGAFMLSSKKSKESLLSNKYARYFFLFVAAQTISVSTTWLTGGFSMFKEVWLPIVIIFILLAKSCTDEQKVKWILVMIIAGISYLSYYSLNDYYRVISSGNLDYTYRVVGFGWYELANDLCFIFIAVIPLAFYMAETTKNFFLRYLFIFLCGVFTLNTLLTGSRNGLLGLLVVIPLSLYLSDQETGVVKSKVVKTGLLALVMLSILTIGIAAVTARRDLSSGQLLGDESSENRIVQWKACFRMVIDNPLFGVGPGESRFQMRNYGGIRGVPPHNTLVQVFADTGIPGGIFFIFCTVYPLWDAWRFFKNRHDTENTQGLVLYRYLTISLFGLWVCSFFSNRVYFKIPYVLIALIIAVRTNVLRLSNNDVV